jgi:hypothetical protein
VILVSDLKPGDKILYKKHVLAIVREISSRKVHIEFADGPMKGTLLVIDIDTIHEADIIKGSESSSPPQPPPAVTTQRLRRGPFSQRHSIDALRYGLVPLEYIEHLTLGYNEIDEWIDSTLPHNNEDNPTAHQVIAEFGEGKSHTMGIIRYKAMKEGYLVGKVEIDGIKVSLSDPKSLYFTIFSQIRGNGLDSAMPLLGVYRLALKSGYNGPFVSTEGFDDRINEIYSLIRLLERYNCLDDCDHVIDSVLTCSEDMNYTEARNDIVAAANGKIHPYDIKFHSLIGHKMENRPYDLVEALIGTTLIARLAGFKGLVVTIDECEVEEHMLGKSGWNKAFKTISALFEYMGGERGYPLVPISLYFSTVPSTLFENDAEKWVDGLVKISQGKFRLIVPFEGWDSENPDHRELMRRIHNIYLESYHCDKVPEEEIIRQLNQIMETPEALDSGRLRYFMKQYIGLLDALYGPPGDNSRTATT